MILAIEKYIDDVIRREGGKDGRGGYTNNPVDAGGETIWGVTAAVARAFGYLGPMKSMPRETAVEVYRQRYWLQPRFDQVQVVLPALAEKLLDIGVNTGTATGVKFLQRALNVLNLEGRIFPDMAADGVLGAMTLAGLKAYQAARPDDGAAIVLSMMKAFQSVYYVEIAERRPSQEVFESGWQNRVLSA